jgi:hypothetical protein
MVTRKWESRHRHRPMVGEKSVRIGPRGRPTGLRSAPTGATADNPLWNSSIGAGPDRPDVRIETATPHRHFHTAVVQRLEQVPARGDRLRRCSHRQHSTRRTGGHRGTATWAEGPQEEWDGQRPIGGGLSGLQGSRRGGRHGIVAATTSVTSPDSITAPVRHREAVTSGRSDLAPGDPRRSTAPGVGTDQSRPAGGVRQAHLRGSGGAVAAVCARRIREGTQGSRQPGCAEPGSGLPRYEIGSAARRYAAPWGNRLIRS